MRRPWFGFKPPFFLCSRTPLSGQPKISLFVFPFPAPFSLCFPLSGGLLVELWPEAQTRTFGGPWQRPESTIFSPTLCEFMPFCGWQSYVHRARFLPVSNLSRRDHVIGRDDLPRNSLSVCPGGHSEPHSQHVALRRARAFVGCTSSSSNANDWRKRESPTPGENPFDACGPSRCFGHNFTPSCPCLLPDAWLRIGFGAILVAGGLTTRCNAVRPTSISCLWRTLGRSDDIGDGGKSGVSSFGALWFRLAASSRSEW